MLASRTLRDGDAHPGAAEWYELLPRLAELGDRACRELAPHIVHIPDALREVPPAWLELALAGAPPPALQLCRSLNLAERRHDDGEPGRLLRLPGLAGLTRLTIGMDARELEAAWLIGLHALQTLRIETRDPFTSALRDEQLATIAAAPALRRLSLLSLDMVDLRGPGVAALARSSTLPSLAELDLHAPATAAVCKALALESAPALRGVWRLALCADHFTSASAAALARAGDLLAGLRILEFRVDESGGFDWAEPFSGREGAANSRRFAGALARLLPALRDCDRVTIDHRPARQVVHIARADFERLSQARALRAAFPPRMAAG